MLSQFRFVPKDSYQFDQSLFRSLEVFGQVDAKFIAAKSFNNGQKLLLLFDQVDRKQEKFLLVRIV